MHTDITRATFHPEKHYRMVTLQQGRVQLDADTNEQSAIQEHLDRTTRVDVIGACGAPMHNAGFQVTLSGGELAIGAGRYYVDGILCENEDEVPIAGQPDLPDFALPTRNGLYIAYLDVWTRTITALQDPSLREVALGGPDTASREKTIWQVKLLRAGNRGSGITCASTVTAWNNLIAPSTARLRARAVPVPPTTGPCIVPPGAGFRGLSNHLYLVEVHDPGALGTATFKWSRDNGSVASQVTAINDDEVTVATVGQDTYLAYKPEQWIEMTDDRRQLLGEPGVLVRVSSVQGEVLTVDLATATGSLTDADFPQEYNPVVRRWDSDGLAIIATPAENDGFIALEDGVEVQFATGIYRTGDHWLIPARTLTSAVEWPTDTAGDPLPLPPEGVAHHYCRLAIVDIDGGNVDVLSDCRNIFPPLTELISLFYLAGDGQEVVHDPTQPDEFLPLPQELQVGVANGQHPVEGVIVRFSVIAGNGRLQGAGPTADVATGTDGIASCPWEVRVPDSVQRVEATLLDSGGNAVHLPIRFTATLLQLTSMFYAGGDGQSATPDPAAPDARLPLPSPLRVGVTRGTTLVSGATVRFQISSGNGRLQGTSSTVEVATGSDGIASCTWELDSATLDQRVDALLLDAAGTPIHLPVTFAASLRTASRVSYDPSSCANLAGAKTVQEAIDILCSIRREEPGIPVHGVFFTDGEGNDQLLVNDSSLPVLSLLRGLRLVCEAPVEPGMVKRPTCFVTVEMPFPLNTTDMQFWASSGFGFQPVILEAESFAEAETIHWRPGNGASAWLAGRLFQMLREFQREERILAHLTVKGNFITGRDDPDLYLDGDTFGVLSRTETEEVVDVRWPTGDGRRGGDLEMWFWLVPQRSGRIVIGIIPNRISTLAAEPRVLDAINLSINRGALTAALPDEVEVDVSQPLNPTRARRLIREAGVTQETLHVLVDAQFANAAGEIEEMLRSNARFGGLEVTVVDDVEQAVAERLQAGQAVDIVIGDENVATRLAATHPNAFEGNMLRL